MIYLILSSITILLLLNVLIVYSLKRMNGAGKKGKNQVNISIIIAAKNEAENIDGLIESLKKLDYPTELFEVTIVDDNSIDDTLIKLTSNTASFNNFSIYDLKSFGKDGEREALTLGINNSKHPFILIADADCLPERNWLKAYSNKFDQDYDLLFGIAPFYQHKTIINKISCFENLRSSLLSFSMECIGALRAASR